MGTIKFLMDSKVREISNADPTKSILSWLRYDARRTGSKEGCAEGDCGACSVVLGELVGERVVYRAVNACIVFLPMLDGKELITIESLTDENGLHPVQQAMADADGSQCGFCTPGFVMSLFARHLRTDPALPASIDDVIAGNLCRCTGYGPIKAAAALADNDASRGKQFGGPETVKTLQSIRRSETMHLNWIDPILGEERSYFAPRTIDRLIDLVAEFPDAIILAGGTDVGLWVTKHHRNLGTVISVNDVAGFSDIIETDNDIVIGAGAKYSDAWSVLGEHYPDFGELIRRIGSVQVRNSGTIGGNVANGSPIGDTPPALIALGAELVLTSRRGERVIPLEDFFIDYGVQDLRKGELVYKILVPKPAKNEIFRSYKLSKRFDQDISAVCGAFRLTVDGDQITDARIGFGGMAATPKRALACEKALIGSDWSEQTFQNAAHALVVDYAPISDMRASEDYRMRSAQNLVLKLFAERNGPSNKTRLIGSEMENA